MSRKAPPKIPDIPLNPNDLKLSIYGIKSDLKKQSALFLKKMKNKDSVEFITRPDLTMYEILNCYAGDFLEDEDLYLTGAAMYLARHMAATYDIHKPSEHLSQFKIKMNESRAKLDGFIKVLSLKNSDGGTIEDEIKKQSQSTNDLKDKCVKDLTLAQQRLVNLWQDLNSTVADLEGYQKREHLLDERFRKPESLYSTRKQATEAIMLTLDKRIVSIGGVRCRVAHGEPATEQKEQLTASELLAELVAFKKTLCEFKVRTRNKEEAVKDVMTYFGWYQNDVQLLVTYYIETVKIHRDGIQKLLKKSHISSSEADKMLSEWIAISLAQERINRAKKELVFAEQTLVECRQQFKEIHEFAEERKTTLDAVDLPLD